MFGAAHASHESQMGRNRRTDPAESRVLCPWTGHVSSLRSVVPLAGICSVPALLLCSQAGLQESLRCFFCSWYSVIFCWKYAVDEKRPLVKCKRLGRGGYRAAQPEFWGVVRTLGAKPCWVMDSCTQVKSGLLQFHPSLSPTQNGLYYAGLA